MCRAYNLSDRAAPTLSTVLNARRENPLRARTGDMPWYLQLQEKIVLVTGNNGVLKKSLFTVCSKMFGCTARVVSDSCLQTIARNAGYLSYAAVTNNERNSAAAGQMGFLAACYRVSPPIQS
jgi:hypothetical protein